MKQVKGERESTALKGPYVFHLLICIFLSTKVCLCAEAYDYRELANRKRVVRALKVKKGPKVDGDLSDYVWKLAEEGGPLIQCLPLEAVEPTESTSFKFVYDEKALYMAIWCYDSEPDKIVAREMARDGNLFADDFVFIVFDTFLDKRNGYNFVVNPNGARADGIITNNSRPNFQWDGIWTAKARITSFGWTCEISIPFRTLSFDPKKDTWGFNMSRTIKRKDERDRWNAPFSHLHTFHVAEAGLLTGLEGLKQGLGVQVTPYALGRWRHREDGSDDSLTQDVGCDLRYRITPNLTASLSYNTDFAETEVDIRRINLTRFPLFFPEKREFFLEDAGIFRFGGLGRELIPFFSRRIGLSSEGKQVPIVAAAKLTGRVGDYNLGVLDAYVDKHEGISAQNAFAARISRNIFEQSSAGLITTVGDPNSEEENVVGGFDYTYRSSSFLGNYVLEWNNFALGSYRENARNERPLAFGTEIVFPNDIYIGKLKFYQIDRDFDAALGFVPRRSIRAYETFLSWRPRPESIEWVRQLGFGYEGEAATDLSNRLDTSLHSFRPLWIRFESGDEVFGSFNLRYDAPTEPFEIHEGVVIPRGKYWWDYWRLGFETASKRAIRGEFSWQIGKFYRGKRQEYQFDISLKPIKYLFFFGGYEYNVIRLPEGNFDTHLGRLRLQINVSPDLVWYNLIQYDNVSRTIGYNSRLVWEFRPGAKFFLVLTQEHEEDRPLRLAESVLVAKIRISFRF